MGRAEELIGEVEDRAGPRQKAQHTKEIVNILNFLTTTLRVNWGRPEAGRLIRKLLQ